MELSKKILNRYKLYKHPMLGKKHTNKGENLILKGLSKPVYMYKIIDDQLELKEIFPNSVK
jgi:hypothetical protein